MTASDKFALVTGAGSGIGRATSLGLMNAGWTVALAGRRREAVDETAQLASPGKSICVSCDVRDPSSVQSLFVEIQNRFGRLDLLFNNAGSGAPAVPIEDLPLDAWQRIIETNLTGVFLCTQQAVRIMKSQTPRGGRIINNGSVSAYAPRPNSAYTATKHAITGLTKSTSLDGRKYDIACGQIDIGNAMTDLAKKFAEGVPQANGAIAIEPVIDAKHIADAVVYMASLPLEANVQFITVMATKMPLIGRG